jgi:hypothetical protein
MRSAQIQTLYLGNITAIPGYSLSTYTQSGNLIGFGSFQASNLPSFKPEGFKKINLHGIKITGSLSGGMIALPIKGSIVNWSVYVSVLGQIQELGGVINPYSPIGLTQQIGTYKFTELNNHIDFVSPILAIEDFGIERVFFEAEKMQDPNNLDINLNITTTYFYKYEGEE